MSKNICPSDLTDYNLVETPTELENGNIGIGCGWGVVEDKEE